MNCRDFLSEFEDRNALTSGATLHLNNCPNCQKTSSEQTHVWQMINDLKRVEVPGNFDFHLKARIAKASAADFKSRFPPILRYVLPFSAIVLVFSLFVFNTVFLSDFNVPQVAETSVPASHERENTLERTLTEQADSANNFQSPIGENPAPGNSGAEKQPRESITLSGETKVAAVKLPKTLPTDPIRKTPKEIFTGSRDFSSTTALEKLPTGLSLNKKIETPLNITGGKTLTAAEILSQLGIETVLENGKRIVKTVRQKSVGEMSDVKNGDIIEAIDGKSLTDKPTSGSKIEGKTLTVTRGAEKKEIPLRNQPN